MTRTQPAMPRSHRDYNPQKAPRLRGAESRPGSGPTGTSGRARGSRRRRKRRATVLPVIPCPCLSFPPHPKLGLVGSTSPLTPGTRLPFCFVSGIFFSHVTRGAGPRLGQRLLGNSRPSTPAGLGLWGTLPRPFCPPRACVPAVGPRSKYALRRGRSFYGFQQVLSGSVATRGYGTGGLRGRPEAITPGLRANSGPWAFGVSLLRCPRARGCGLGVSSLHGRMDFLVFLGGPRKT